MDEIYKGIVSAGMAGAMIAWILWKLIPTIEGQFASITETIKGLKEDFRRLEAAQDRATLTALLKLAAAPSTSDELKERVEELITEIRANQHV